MTNRGKRTISLVCAMILFSLTGWVKADESSSLSRDVVHLADVWLHAQKDHARIPALMGMIVKDQQVVWRGAAGVSNVQTQTAASTATLSSVCSVSKVFTATAILKLVDEGTLSLDDNILQWLPDYRFKQAHTDGGPVTLRSLLTHTSGLPRDTEHGYWSAPEFPFPDKLSFLHSVRNMQTQRAVGEAIHYSNVGYALLGEVIQAATGMPYKLYMEQQVFRPLGMTATTVDMPLSEHGKQHAMGYSALDRTGQREPVSHYQTKALQGAAGISTSIDDLASYVSWLFAKPDDQQPLALMGRGHRNSLLRDQTSADTPGSRGFGFDVYRDEAGNVWATHGGMCPGYHSFLKLNVTQKAAYVVMTNANQVRALDYVKGLEEIWRFAGQRKVPVTAPVAMTQYAGFYDPAPWNSHYYVSPWGDGLMFMYLPSATLKHALYHYQHIQGDVFALVQDGELSAERIEFLRDDNGNVVQVLDGANAHRRMINQ